MRAFIISIASEGKMEKVNSYNEDAIQVLEGLEPVRVRPGMYIGSTDERGLHHLVSEIVDNSIDEALAGYCTDIYVVVNKDGSVSVEDNGRGIPTGFKKSEGKSAVEVVLTKLHAGGKFGGSGYTISGGLHGVGLSVVNALSEWLVVEVSQNGHVYRQEYSRGKPQTELKIVGDTDKTGTKVSFFPDSEIFETTVFKYEVLKHRLRELAYLNKGLHINIKDLRPETPIEDDFRYEGGIIHFVEDLNSAHEKLFSEIVYFDEKVDTSEVEIALQYNETYNETVFAYANNINTEEGGTHLDGFKAALTRIINDYGHKFNILKDNEKLSGEDVREGLTAVINVKLTNPQFEGQTKTKLGNSEMRTIVSRVLTECLGTYMEEHPKESKDLVLRSINAQKAKEAARKVRDETRRKGFLENTTLPGKLADCTEKDASKCEIFLVEGDSAGGSAKSGRDRRFQAILPLRGKILNVEKARLNHVLENEEIKSMITAFGGGIGEEFSTSKLRYDKIICMTDADVDGSHIRILMLTFFFRFMKPLIEEGHVYIAQPPLYKVSKGKEEKYFYNDDDLNTYLDSLGRKGYEIQRYKGLGEMDPEQLWETTMSPESRILLKVRLEDAIKADETFTVLMGEQPELRRQFIEENAKLVAELDI